MPEEGHFRTVAYFVNWAIYGRNHHPQDLPADKLTHVLYAFANVRPESGEVYLTDTWSDIEKHYPNDTWNEPTPGPHIYGCLKQLNLLKQRNRNLKILLSIGGWTYSSNFAPAASSSAGRKCFADTAVTLVKDCGFDGLDIDWEYPRDEKEANDFVSVLKTTRGALHDYEKALGLAKNTFQLTVACPAGPENFRKLKIAEMDQYLDFWNLMAYDYAGGWDRHCDHQANIFPPGKGQSRATPFSTVEAVAFYARHGVDRRKLVIGCPLYGRQFVGVEGDGQPGQKYTGGVGEGSWESGVWDLKVLPRPGSQVRFDEQALASWSWDPKTRTFVSFDAGPVVAGKADWIAKEQLGGAMWWESSGDSKAREGSAIEGVHGRLSNGIEMRQNVADYPRSKYRNLREGFPGG